MINLKIGEQFLEIGEAKITIEIYNAILQIGIIRDNFSYSFTIPYTPQNEKILGSVGKVASTDLHQDSLQCEIYINNLLWASGILTVEEASQNNFFKVKIDFGFGAFSSQIGDKKLKNIYDSLLLDASDYSQIIPTIPTNYIYFKADIDWFFISPPPIATGGAVGYQILLNGTAVANAAISYPISDMEAVTLALVSDFNANVAVNTDFRAYYRKQEGDVLNRHIDILPLSSASTDEFILRRIEGGSPTDFIFTVVTETAPNPAIEYAHICYPYISANQFYGTANEDFLGKLNDGFGVALYYNTAIWLATLAPSEPADYNRYAHTPCLKLFSLITHICKSVGWTWGGELATDAVFEKLLIYSNYASDQSRQIGSYFFNEHQRAVAFATLCPDLSVKEFFEQIQEMLCLYYEFDVFNKILYINFKKTPLRALPTDSLRAKMVLKRELVEKKKNILLQYNQDLNIANYFPPNASQGDFTNTETYNIRAGAMPYEYPNAPALWTEKGNSQMFGLGETNNRNNMYLFFWRGSQTIDGVSHPTAEAKDTFGVGSLDWTYLYENLWKEFVSYLLTNKKAEGIIWSEINFIRKALRTLAEKYEYAYLHFLIEKMQIEIDAKSTNIVGAKIEVRKLGL